MFWAGVVVGGVGDIACFGGIYYLLKSASPDAAKAFLLLSVIAYFLLAFVDFGIDAYKS